MRLRTHVARGLRTRLFAEQLEPRTTPATFTISTTADSGAGSFRQAIIDANAAAGADTIAFVTLSGAVTLAATLPTITDSVTVVGAGATVTAGGALRTLPVAAATTFRGLTFTGGVVLTASSTALTLDTVALSNDTVGGQFALTATAGTMTLSASTVTGNTAGGIRLVGGSLTATGSAFTGNAGQAVRSEGASVAAVGCTFANNTASSGAAVWANAAGTIALTNSTLSGNTATGGAGAVYTSGGTTLTLDGCTLSGNSATGATAVGGAVVTYSGVATIRNSTLTKNTAAGLGGAIAAPSNGTTLTIQSSVVAANAAGVAAADVFRPFSGTAIVASASVIGAADTFPYQDGGGNATGTAAAPLDPRLGPLAANGGPTQTHALLATSPAVGRGANPTGAATDGRGVGYPRQVGTAIDAGAVEYSGAAPAAAATANPVRTAGGTGYGFTVAYSSNAAAVKAASLDGNLAAVTVTGPAGPLTLTGAYVDSSADGPARTVTYVATAPGGMWDAGDNGVYTITIGPTPGQDTAGTAVPAGVLWAFPVAIAQQFTVTTLADSGTGSLRDAITRANANAATADTIAFQAGLTGTVTLASGLPTITDSMTIAGAGAMVSVNGAKAARPFAVNNRNNLLAVALSDLTVTNGAAATGGAIYVETARLDLTNVTLAGNTATASGGAVFSESNSGLSTVTLTACVLDGNAATDGGGVYASYAIMTLDRTTVRNNAATAKGGGVYVIGQGLTVTGSTFSGNAAPAGGGGVWRTTGGITVDNSTFVGNSATAGTGGAIGLLTASATLRHVTAAGNTAAQGGGLSLDASTATLTNVVVAANAAGVGPDVTVVSGTLTVNTSLIGVADNVPYGGSGNATGTAATPLDPLLGPLQANGGPTLTRLPLAGSPAVNLGTTTALSTDQRGAGYARTAGARPDAGAVERSPVEPSAALTAAPRVRFAGGTSYSFAVRFDAPAGMKAATLSNNLAAVVVTGPGGATVPLTAAAIDTAADGTPRTVTYTLTPPGGAWDYTDNGAYAIAVAAGQATDTGGIAVPATTVGTFLVNIVTVTTLADGGPGSLRQAILDTNVLGGVAETVPFAPGLSGTILLTGPLPTVTDSVTIDGAGATVTVDGGGLYRPFTLDGAGTIDVGLRNLTVSRGYVAGNGGAVFNNGERLTLADVTIRDSRATGSGGGVFAAAGSAVTVTTATFLSNAAANGGALLHAGAGTVSVTGATFLNNTAAGVGGAVSIATAATITTSVFQRNVARSAGGAVYSAGTAIIVIASTTVAGNAADYGAGLYQSATAAVQLTATTFADNRAGISGAGVYVAAGGTVAVDLCTFTGNAAKTGGAIYIGGSPTVTVRSTTVVANRAVGSPTSAGGGIALANASASPTLAVLASVVAGNAATVIDKGDIFRAPATGGVTVTQSVVGVAAFAYTSGGGNATGSAAAPLDPLLAPRGLAGGPTQVLVPLPGSPVLDRGDATSPFATDQRGFPRVVGGKADAGAVERGGTAFPTATASAPDIEAAVPTATVTVVYADETAVSVASVNGNLAAVTVAGPYPVSVVAAVAVPTADAKAITVTYTLAGPGGGWDAADNGAYTIALVGNQAKNAAGTAAASGTLAVFAVHLGQTFTVTTLADSGPGSLRQALLDGNASRATADTVAFQPGLTGTVTLAASLPAVTDSVTVTGPGAGALTVSGAGLYQILNVAGTGLLDVRLTGLTLANGKAAGGGAITVDDDRLTLTGVVVANNQATTDGGGVYVLGNAEVTITDSTFRGNAALGTSLNGGGALYARSYPTVTLTRTTVSGNTASNGFGGGLYFFYGGALDVTNSTFAGNVAKTGGAVASFTADITFRHVTIAGNTATVAGGGVASVAGGTVTVDDSIVGDNTAPSGPDLSVGSVAATTSLFATTTGFTLAAGSAGNLLDVPTGLSLTLADNGGPTRTLRLLPASAAIDAGGATTLTTDQRGPGYPRTLGTKPDLGAVEIDVRAPTATAILAPVTTRKAASYTFAVTLADDVAVAAATVQGADFTVTGPGGYTQAAALVGLSPAGDGSPLTAMLRVVPPGGTWDVADNGTYTVSLTGTVADTSGNAAATGPLGTFAVQAPVAVQAVVAVLPDGTTTPLGTGQGSIVPVVRITFDGLATGADLAAAYRLVNTSTGTTVTLAATTTTVNGKTVATLTPPATLADGYYTLTVFGTAVGTTNTLPTAVALDGDDNGTAGGNYALNFSRYLGDADGDGAVDGNDLAALAQAFNSVDGDSNYRFWLDLDGDGAIDGNDLAIIAQRFNTVL